MSEFRICGNDYVYCDGECDKCPRLIPTYATSSTDTVLPHTSEYIMRGTSNGWGEYVGELIRCEYCKHWDGYFCHNKWWGNGYGNYAPPIKKKEGFCDWAERKEE